MPEYLVGTIEVAGELVVDDAANAGRPAFMLARSLESALELVELGRPELALEICAKASHARRVLAAWTRVLALAAQRDDAATREATTLAEEWLRPADSTDHASQVLPRAHVLRALDATAAGAALRARVVSAPEPDVFVADGGGDFF